MRDTLIRALLGIASCATKCSCCEMHQDIARRTLKEYRASLTGEEAAEFDRMFRTPFEFVGFMQ